MSQMFWASIERKDRRMYDLAVIHVKIIRIVEEVKGEKDGEFII